MFLGQEIVYQIYPKSFKDTNGDGIGDLQGITSKLGYLANLGVTVLWLNPIYVSPQVDNGYDICDYYNIDEHLGTLDDFKKLVAKAHELGLKVILDFVMNHTSDQHPWFQAFLKDKQSKYKDYYLIKQKDKRPNNWASFFGGSVWEKIDADNYYFHLFDKKMPDLNWENQAVRQEMLKIAQFWLKQGVDGFRLDAFIHLAKADFAQNVVNVTKDKVHIAEEYYANLPRVQVYLKEFIDALRTQKPDIFIMGEGASADVNLITAYTKDSLCDTVVSFRLLPTKRQADDSEVLDFAALKEVCATWLNRIESPQAVTLYWSNHDMARILEKITLPGDDKLIAKMLATLMYLQKGTPCIYYGEEIGMRNLQLADILDFEDSQLTEPYENELTKNNRQELLAKYSKQHKMAARGAMQWDDSIYSGFSTVQAWKNGKHNDVNVAQQQSDSQSLLQHYRQVLALKKDDLFANGSYILEDLNSNLYAYKRKWQTKEAYVICNLSNERQLCLLSKDYQQILVSGEVRYLAKERQLSLGAFASVVLLNETKEESTCN